MAIFLETAEKSGFRPGVLHQPLAPGPCTRFRRGFEERGSEPAWAGVGFRPPERPPGSPAPGPQFPAREGRRAPPRGVDVKATPGRARGGPSGTPESEKGPGDLPRPLGQGSGIPDPEPPGPRSRGTPSGQVRRGWAALPGPWEPPAGRARARVLHQPLAAGPCPGQGSREPGVSWAPRPGGPGLTA